jgi:hypothetical protein
MPFRGLTEQICSLHAQSGSKTFPRRRSGAELTPRTGMTERFSPDMPIGRYELSPFGRNQMREISPL